MDTSIMGVIMGFGSVIFWMMFLHLVFFFPAMTCLCNKIYKCYTNSQKNLHKLSQKHILILLVFSVNQDKICPFFDLCFVLQKWSKEVLFVEWPLLKKQTDPKHKQNQSHIFSINEMRYEEYSKKFSMFRKCLWWKNHAQIAIFLYQNNLIL